MLDEVAGKWTSYSDVSQRAIAKAMAGTNHMEQFLVLMGNYKKAQEYEKYPKILLDLQIKSMKFIRIVWKVKQKILKTHFNLSQQHLLIKPSWWRNYFTIKCS